MQAEKEEQGAITDKTAAKEAQPDQWAADTMPPPPMQAPEVTDWATEAMAVPPTLTGGSFMGGTAMTPAAPVAEDWSVSAADDWSKSAAPPQPQQQQPTSQWGGETENWG